jgi:hypothetical protein
MLSRRLHAVADRIAASLVRRKILSARATGYRHLPAVTLPDYCGPGGGACVEHEPAKVLACPLPLNIRQRDELSRNCGRYERSFYDVPEFQLAARYSATVENCRILRHRDKWGDDFYTLLTQDDEQIQYSGTSFLPAHRDLLRRNVSTRAISEVTWITTHSTRNHYMWLYNHLTRLMLAEDLGLQQFVLFPEKSLLSSVKQDTLQRLGYNSASFIQPDDQVMTVDRLHLMEADSFDPWALTRLRARLGGTPTGPASRRIYVSRQKCHYRKLRNDAELQPWLKENGFETVFLEDLSLDQQIETMQSAKIVLGVHGAGFANLLFCQPGTRVIEIQDPDDPNPHFYALAALLGLDYCLLIGDVDAAEESHFRDVSTGRSAIAGLLT